MISICMPYFERQAELDRTLASYHRLYAELDHEIVIVDDGSPFPCKAEGPRLRLERLPEKQGAKNPCVPINAAVEAAKGDVIVLTNPEVEHRTDVLTEMRRRLKRNTYATAACRDVTTGEWLARTGLQNGRLPLPEGAQFHFCAMFYKSTWNKAGGFDEAYRDGQACEDADWLWKLDAAGVKFMHCDDLVVYHHRTPSRWPSGGLQRNQKLFCEKWNQSLLPA